MVVAIDPSGQAVNRQQIFMSEDGLQVDLHLSLKLGITAQQAKRKLSRFLLNEVSLFLGPAEPLLVFEETCVIWRFPIEFTMARYGRIGQVGLIDVDAQTGELKIAEEQLVEIRLNARLFAQNASFPTDT